MAQSDNVRTFATYNNNRNDPTLNFDDGDGTFDDMDKERLAKLEGAFDGLKANQAILMTAIGLVSAILIALGSFTLAQLTNLNSKYSELPGKISSDLREMNNTLLQAVTAAKGPSQPPQVIVIPREEKPATTQPN